MDHNPVVYIGDDAAEALLRYAEAEKLEHLSLVADANTYAALGGRVEQQLRSAGLEVRTIMVPGPEPVIADEPRLIQAMLGAPPSAAPSAPPRQTTYVGVGSGTVTDVARFISFHSRDHFISMPTAASMDGYATSNNVLNLSGLKVSVPGHAPEAIFCDLPTLAGAPRAMNAAGLGDTLAKFTSANDLRLGHLVWGERAESWERDEPIADRMERLAQTAMVRAGEIAAAEPKALAFLIRALLDSGLAMADFGNSMPGSGSEHHISHCWEMRALLAGEPGLLHGAKVGVGTVIAAGWYGEIRNMTQREAANRLAGVQWPDAGSEIGAIEQAYGPLAADIVKAQQPFLTVTAEQWAELKWRILEQWEDIRAIAARIPSPSALADALRAAGGPGSPEELGLGAEEIEVAMRNGHFTRPRFTIARLRLLLGIQ